MRQTFDTLVIHTPTRRRRCGCPGRSRRSTTGSSAGCSSSSATRVRDREGGGAAAPRNGDGAIADRDRPRHRRARRSSSTLSAGGGSSAAATATSRPTRRSRAGSRSIRAAAASDLEIWIDRAYVPAGYGWSFPAGDEIRVGVGSFDPRFHVKEPTVRLADDLDRDAVRYQGNWIPHKLRERDRGRRLLRRRLGRPLPAADRRGHPHRLLLRHRLRARAARGDRRPPRPRDRPPPLRRFNAAHDGSSAGCCGSSGRSRACRRACSPGAARDGHRPLRRWSFGHYLSIAPPEFAASADDQERPGEQQDDPALAPG